MRERVRTTEARTKELRPLIERLVTRAKSDTVANRRRLAARLPAGAVKKIFTVIAPRFLKRSGGYTRIIKLGARQSDSSQQAIIEFVS